MTAIVGGLRARLIHDSLWETFSEALGDLGWFAPNRRHQTISFVTGSQNVEIEVPLNTLALSDEDVISRPQEIGSQFAEMTRTFYLDFFAENDSVGKHLMGDMRDILEGRMPSLGFLGPNVPIYDLRQATPPMMFYVEIANVRLQKAHNWPHRWLQHWYSIDFQALDYYAGDEDVVSYDLLPQRLGTGSFGSGTFGHPRP